MSDVKILYDGNDHIVEVRGLKNVATGEYINDATVQATLKDSEDANVSGQSWPTTLSYVTGSNGKYRATLEDGLSLTVGDRYTAEITADGGDGLKAKWSVDLLCKARIK